MPASVVIPVVVSGTIGFLGSIGLFINGALDRRRANDAERRAAEAEHVRARLDELNRDRDYLLQRVGQLDTELQQARAGENSARNRANRIDEQLSAARKDLQLAEREIERLKARLGEL